MTQHDQNLATWLGRWLAVCGYIIAVFTLVQVGVEAATTGLTLQLVHDDLVLRLIYWDGFLMYTGSHVFLLVGCVGMQLRQPWSRRFLLTYATLNVVGLVMLRSVPFFDGQWSGAADYLMAIANVLLFLKPLLTNSIYPVLLACLAIRRDLVFSSASGEPQAQAEPAIVPPTIDTAPAE